MFNRYVAWPIVDFCLPGMLLGQLTTFVCQICYLANCRLMFTRYVTWPIVDLYLPDTLLGSIVDLCLPGMLLGPIVDLYLPGMLLLGQLSAYVYQVCYLANCRLMFTRYVNWT